MANKSHSSAYAAAGVDINAGYEAVERMKKHIARTRTAGVRSDIGGFGGIFAPDLAGLNKPLLVSGTDGVGTKLKLAFLLDKHDTIGIDCVAMCVNDVICCGARPLFFLDYIACGKNDPVRIEQIVAGVAEGCAQASAALIGGETAEMPGFYPEDEYDLAGYCTGLVDEDQMIDPAQVAEGDVIIALPSSGVHSNGFSLVRQIFDIGKSDHNCTAVDFAKEVADLSAEAVHALNQITLGELLLTPTRIYVKPVLALMDQIRVHGISHITGGGFYENIPRAIPEGLCAQIDRADVRVLPVFELIGARSGLSAREMFSTFNMGVGMTVTVAAADAERALDLLRAQGEEAYVLGEIVRAQGDDRVVITGI